MYSNSLVRLAVGVVCGSKKGHNSNACLPEHVQQSPTTLPPGVICAFPTWLLAGCVF
jgi:hypothetical protein